LRNSDPHATRNSFQPADGFWFLQKVPGVTLTESKMVGSWYYSDGDYRGFWCIDRKDVTVLVGH